MLKVVYAPTQILATTSASSNGANIPTKQAGVISAQCNITAASIVGGTVCLQKSNDGINFVNDGTPQTVAATGTYFLEKSITTSAYMRVAYVLTSGTIASGTIILVQANY